MNVADYHNQLWLETKISNLSTITKASSLDKQWRRLMYTSRLESYAMRKV